MAGFHFLEGEIDDGSLVSYIFFVGSHSSMYLEEENEMQVFSTQPDVKNAV